jgi:hypothetical protein
MADEQAERVARLRAELADLQAEHDARQEKIKAIQKTLAIEEHKARAEAMLDALPADERDVLIEAASIRMGHR